MNAPKIPPMKHMMWLDLEMTGLDPVQNKIIEAAIVITDLHFNEIEIFDTAVYQPSDELDKMDAWCNKTHTKSGLVKRIPDGMAIVDLDSTLFALCGRHFTLQDRIVLCGNSIGQDRKFIDLYLPKFSGLLHYRMLDVSSFKLVFENCFKKKFKKENKHSAVDDIRESIQELKYYMAFLDEAKLNKQN